MIISLQRNRFTKLESVEGLKQWEDKMKKLYGVQLTSINRSKDRIDVRSEARGILPIGLIGTESISGGQLDDCDQELVY